MSVPLGDKEGGTATAYGGFGPSRSLGCSLAEVRETRIKSQRFVLVQFYP